MTHPVNGACCFGNSAIVTGARILAARITPSRTGFSAVQGLFMPPTRLTTLDESILEAKRCLDAARRDGRADAIREWASRLDRRLDRKLVLMGAARG